MEELKVKESNRRSKDSLLAGLFHLEVLHACLEVENADFLQLKEMFKALDLRLQDLKWNSRAYFAFHQVEYIDCMLHGCVLESNDCCYQSLTCLSVTVR